MCEVYRTLPLIAMVVDSFSFFWYFDVLPIHSILSISRHMACGLLQGGVHVEDNVPCFPLMDELLARSIPFTGMCKLVHLSYPKGGNLRQVNRVLDFKTSQPESHSQGYHEDVRMYACMFEKGFLAFELVQVARFGPSERVSVRIR